MVKFIWVILLLILATLFLFYFIESPLLFSSISCPYCTIRSTQLGDYPAALNLPPAPLAPPAIPPASPPSAVAPAPQVVPPPAPPPVPENQTCPVASMKMQGCVDLLFGIIHIDFGEKVKKVCCPLLFGLVGVDAALCLCMTMRGMLLDMGVFLPLLVELLLYCEKTPPPGFSCPPP